MRPNGIRYADLSGLFAVAQSTIVPISVPKDTVKLNPVKKRPRSSAVLLSCKYSWEKVMKYPLARPMMKRPAYSAPIFSVDIMMMFATKQVTQASARQARRPKRVEGTPAVAELINAPSVMREEMSCCLSVVMFHPVGDFGAGYPNT
jgi:hypothetical protein